MTYSIVAFDPETGDFGVAVQSKFIGVGPIVPWAQANVGAVATQAFANTTFGPRGLALLKEGQSAELTVRKLLTADPDREQRQLGVVDSHGNAYSFTGKECYYWAGHAVGDHFACQGNILVSEETVQEMASAYESTRGDLVDKLLAALTAADQEGRGDVRGKQSSALLVVREQGGYGGFTDRLVDVRVDDSPEPIQELKRIFHLYEMTFLTREEPTNLWTIEGDVADQIRSVLHELGYLPSSRRGLWLEEETQALEAWFGINNFENKWEPGKIWKSVYDYMITEKSTPVVTLKRMSDF